MAKLWYAREGKRPVVSWPNEKRPLAEYESLLGMKKEHYHGIDGPKFGRQDKQVTTMSPVTSSSSYRTAKAKRTAGSKDTICCRSPQKRRARNCYSLGLAAPTNAPRRARSLPPTP